MGRCPVIAMSQRDIFLNEVSFREINIRVMFLDHSSKICLAPNQTLQYNGAEHKNKLG